MREILFRGKRKDNGEWVEGAFYAYYDFKRTRVQILKDRTNGRPDAYEVDPETVGQYTGLTDKNGKKIFEGDIVTEQSYPEKDKNKNSIIEYGEWNCSCCYGVYGWVSNGFVDFWGCDVIVIGNIHDNPELLKEGAKQ